MKTKNTMTENTSEVAQVAADFAGQYTDEELLLIGQKSPAEMKAYLEAVAVSCLEFAEENTGKLIHVLPGRPDRPKKPQV